MKYPEMMIDIETLGTSANAPIIQIGAVGFDSFQRSHGPAFCVNVEPDLTRYAAEYSTICWWMQQSQGAKDSVFGGSVPLAEGLAQFKTWCLMEVLPEAKVWAMPPSFDLVILEDAFREEGKGPPPWRYNKTRCLRTLFDIAEIDKSERVEPLIPHNAGSDAQAQVRSLFKALENLDMAGLA